jgi:hypothetical protein
MSQAVEDIKQDIFEVLPSRMPWKRVAKLQCSAARRKYLHLTLYWTKRRTKRKVEGERYDAKPK